MGFPGYNFAFPDGYTHGYPDNRAAHVQPDFPADLYPIGHSYPDTHFFSYLYTHRLSTAHWYRDCHAHVHSVPTGNCHTHFHAQSNIHPHANPLPDDNRLTYNHSQSDQNANINIYYIYSKPDSLYYSYAHKYEHTDSYCDTHSKLDCLFHHPTQPDLVNNSNSHLNQHNNEYLNSLFHHHANLHANVDECSACHSDEYPRAFRLHYYPQRRL